MRDRLLAMPVIGTAIRVQDRYTEDAADNFAAAIGFFGFLSLLPLILFGLSAVGFVIRGDASLQQQIIEAVNDAVPGLSTALGPGGLESLVASVERNAGSLLSIGALTLLYTGLKVIAGAQRALAVVFRMDVITGVAARLQQVLALVVLGTLALLGSALGAGAVGVEVGGGLATVLVSIGLTLVTFLVDFALFLVAYRLLSPDPGAPPWRVLVPGAVFAAVVWVALKAGLSSLLVSQGDESVYGALAGAAGLLVLLYLAGRVFMYGAVLSAYRGGLGDSDDDSTVDEPMAEPRPAEDVAPPPVDLAKLTGSAAVLALAVRVLDRD